METSASPMILPFTEKALPFELLNIWFFWGFSLTLEVFTRFCLPNHGCQWLAREPSCYLENHFWHRKWGHAYDVNHAEDTYYTAACEATDGWEGKHTGVSGEGINLTGSKFLACLNRAFANVFRISLAPSWYFSLLRGKKATFQQLIEKHVDYCLWKDLIFIS